MCCPLDPVNRTPTTFVDWIYLYFQRVELLEKIAEIADESFHFLRSVLEQYTSVGLYQTASTLHQSSHELEHFLHTFCFLGDVFRLFTGKFWESDFLRNVARVCHAVSHFLASVTYLSEKKIYPVRGVLEKCLKYQALFSAVGYALWTITLVWQRSKGEQNENFYSDMGIHLGGFLFEALSVENDSIIIHKIKALSGMIHAWCVVQRLMPREADHKDSASTDHSTHECGHH